MSTCSLSGNTLTCTSDIIFDPSSNPNSLGQGIRFKAISGPIYYISTYNDLIIESGATISLNILNTSGTSTTYGSFYNETNPSFPNTPTGPNIPTGPNNLTIVSGNNGSNLGSIKFLGAGPQYSISVAVGNGYLSSVNLSLYYDQTVNNGSAIINTPNQLALTSLSNIYLNAGSNIGSASTSNTIYLQNGGATYGSFSSGSGGNLVISSLGNNGVIMFGSYGYVYNNNSNGFTIVSESSNLNLGVNGNINFRNNGNLYGYFNNSAGFTISSQSGDLNLNAAGDNAVTTNYVAPWSSSDSGIINQTALSKIIPTISINNDNPNVLYLQTNNQPIPSYLESDGITKQYYILPPSAGGMYFLNMTDAGKTQHTCFIVVCTSQSVNNNTYNVTNLNNGGCYVTSVVTFTPYNGAVLNVTVPGGIGGIYNWIPLLLT